MLNLILLKILRRVKVFITTVLKKVYIQIDSESLYPLLNKPKKTIQNTSGIYWRLFQSQISAVRGMTSDEEAEKLFILSLTQDLKGDIVEIGSWLGKSTVHLAKGCQVANNGIVHAVDTFKGNVGKESLYTAPLAETETILSRFKKNVKLAKVAKYIKIYPMTSAEAQKMIRKKIRMVFIDGCHEYEFVTKDIQIWAKKLQKGGLIVLDDFTQAFPGVIQAVEEQIITNSDFHVLLNYDSFFIAKKIK